MALNTDEIKKINDLYRVIDTKDTEIKQLQAEVAQLKTLVNVDVVLKKLEQAARGK